VKDTSLAIVGIVIVVLLTLLIFLTGEKDEIVFKKIELSEDISINNLSSPSYYDTILKVGMSQFQMEGMMVNILPLSENAKSQFDGDLSAHLRYFDERFYLFIDSMEKSQAITVISHEIIHMDQYLKEDLVFDGENVFWLGRSYNLSSTTYDVRPWEREAFTRESDLDQKIRKLLID